MYKFTLNERACSGCGSGTKKPSRPKGGGGNPKPRPTIGW